MNETSPTMSKSKKYLIWSAVLLAVCITIICFAGEIQVWFLSKLTSLLILLITFVVGWLLGRYAAPRRRTRDEENVRNITEAQK